jgi:uncharacterized membrane protein
MKRAVASLGAVGFGAAIMYWLDPQNGRRRRAEVRNQAIHWIHLLDNAADVVSCDAANRVRGLVAHLASSLESRPIDDSVLVERIRSALGRVSSHPHAIEVTSQEGRIRLKGPVLARELSPVFSSVSRVPGVKSVENALEPHQQPGTVPALQGQPQPRRHVPELLQENWSPTARLVVGGVGLFASSWGMKRRHSVGALAELSGAGLLLRSATNLPIKRIFGIGPDPRVIEIRKSIEIDALPDEVFAVCNAFELFPRFMRHVRRVSRSSNGTYHWRVTGPAGIDVEWDAVVTSVVPGKLLAWKTETGATVAHAGVLSFEPGHHGGTRLDVHMSYRPPFGVIGHVFAKLLGVAPKKQIDDDLLRLKSLLEQGKATGREETVYLDELAADGLYH